VAVKPLRHRNPLWIEASPRYPGPIRKFNKLVTLFNIMTSRDLGALIDQCRPDIVHTHSMVDLTPWMWQVCKAKGVKLVHTLHDYDLLCIRAALFKDDRICRERHLACVVFSTVKRRYHGLIDQVVAVSNGVMQMHLDYGFFTELSPASRHVIWNPVNLAATGDGVVPQNGTESTKPKLSRTAPLTFGFLGRLVPEKGINILLEACRSLPSQGWELQIAGRAPGDRTTLEAQAEGLPIRFVGFVNPAAFLAQIDVLVVPSIWAEPFGLTVIEAYKAGLPVIGSAIGGIADTIGAVDPGWLVPPGNASALATKMARLVDKGPSGLGGVPDTSAILARVDPEYVIEQYLEVYRRALDGKVSPSIS
jgi:glycosyltransferase involved in cell wall biosynthesis